MKSKINLIWIDDDPRRNQSVNNLKKNINATAKFIDVTKYDQNNLLYEIRTEIDRFRPNLIIIDHKLDKVGGLSTGSTITELIREKLPECPI